MALNKSESLELNIEREQSKLDLVLDVLFKSDQFIQLGKCRDLEEILIKRYETFTPVQIQNYNKLYTKLKELSSEIYKRMNNFHNGLGGDFIDRKTRKLDEVAKQNYFISEAKNIKKMVKQAIILNQIAVEKYKIATKDELIYVQSLGYIKEIVNFIQKNIEKYCSQKVSTSTSVSYNIALPNDHQEDLSSFVDIKQFYYDNITDPIGIQTQKVDLDYINPYLNAESSFMLSYIDESENIELYINIVRGYQSFNCGFLINDEELYDEKKKYLIMLNIIIFIAKKLNIPLKSTLPVSIQDEISGIDLQLK